MRVCIIHTFFFDLLYQTVATSGYADVDGTKIYELRSTWKEDVDTRGLIEVLPQYVAWV